MSNIASRNLHLGGPVPWIPILFNNSQFYKMLNEMFSPEWLEATAHDVGLIKRNRKIDPVTLFWVLVLGFGVGFQRTLALLRRAYQTASAKKLAPSAFYDRFTPELQPSLGSAWRTV